MLTIDTPIVLERPPTIYFGAGAIGKLGEWIAKHAYRHPCVIADPFLQAQLDSLGLGVVQSFTGIRGEPDIPMLQAAVAAARGCDVIIGYGGGSVMDVAKLVAVMQNGFPDLADISGLNRAPKRTVGLVQIPTTAGTGSEAGTRALITDPESLGKIATESPQMLADLAIIDPQVMLSVPSAVTVATGVDAMAHCVEAYTSRRAHPLIDDYAVRGIELVGKYLQRAVENGGDAEARSGMALAAFYGGLCLGPVNTTAGHALSYPLGTRCKIPHGLANALIFPHTLAINQAAQATKTARIGKALGFEAHDHDSTFNGAYAFCANLGLQMRLRDHGVEENALAAMAAEAHAIRRLLDWNPVELSEADILGIYGNAF
ncbi:MAG: iron-containing alcohol dehydrogenase [Cardiobacteriaceae bacterium]|nr:iron-containing alcohol dehydrogenase [Cardiobacteriaceae bacterium]